jgi:hypothetical protein
VATTEVSEEMTSEGPTVATVAMDEEEMMNAPTPGLADEEEALNIGVTGRCSSRRDRGIGQENRSSRRCRISRR